MIIDIASLIYNQRNILKELKMTSPPINFMKVWLNKAKEKDEREESLPDESLRDQFLGGGLQMTTNTIELLDSTR